MSETPHPEAAILSAALELDPAERTTYLDQACAGDIALRQQVEALLAAHDQAESFLERPPGGLEFHGTVLANSPLNEKPGLPRQSEAKAGDKIGRYKLLQQIGEGGCGVVYMAEQEEPVRRRVALKVIKLGMDTKQVVARFEAERQALALMDHPNIAKIYDAGVTGAPVAAGILPAVEPDFQPGGKGVENSGNLEESEAIAGSEASPGGKMPPSTAGETPAVALSAGRPYFVMELVRGIKITDFCNENRLSTEDRLKLFIQVCQAIQHAHQKGVIHRDIKPSNILVTINDSVPVPKVIDFGIAKATQGRLTDHTLFTAFEQFIGTPAYMSPEQVVMTSLDIDTRSDIYSLGVLLYELLTGKTPFDQKELLAAGLDEMRRTIREVEPVKPSTRLTQDLVAADVSPLKTPGISEEKVRADSRRLLQEVRGDLDWIVMKCLEKDRSRRYETANGLAMDLYRHLNNEPVVARPPSRWYEFQKTVRRHKFGFAATTAIITVLVAGVAISTWEARRALRAEREQISLRQQADEARDTAKEHERQARQQQRLASEQELLARRRLYAAQLHLAQQAIETGEIARGLDLLETQRPKEGQEDLRTFEWYHLWGRCNARLVRTLPGHTRDVHSVAFSPDGAILASCGADGTIRLWETLTGREKRVLKADSHYIANCVTFAPDGKTLASAQWGDPIRLWDVSTGVLPRELPGHTSAVRSLAFSPDGRTLASGADFTVKLWNLESGRERATLTGQHGPVMAVAFSSDGRTLAASDGWKLDGNDPVLSLWDLTGDLTRPKLTVGTKTWSLASSPTGPTLATAPEQKIELWDISTGHRFAVLTGHRSQIISMTFAPDGNTLFSSSEDRTVRSWQVPPRRTGTGNLVAGQPVTIRFESANSPLSTANPVKLHLAWNNWNPVVSPDAPMTFNAPANCWEVTVKVPTNAVQLDCVFTDGNGAWDNNGKYDWHFPVATRAEGSAVSPPNREEAATNQIIILCSPLLHIEDSQIIGAHLDSVSTVAISPNGTLLASGAYDGSVKLWDVARAKEAKPPLVTSSFHSHPDIATPGLHALLPSPNGESLYMVHATAAATRFRNLTDGFDFAELRDAVGRRAALSADGKLLAIGSNENDVELWEIATGTLLASVQAHPKGDSPVGINGVAFSPDGHILATGSFEDTHVKLWDVQDSLRPIREIFVSGIGVGALAFSPDGKTLAVVSNHQRLFLFNIATGRVDRLIKLGQGFVLTWAAAFSPDGELLATGSANGGVQLWNVQTGRLHAGLKGHSSTIWTLAFSPDGDTLATGSEDRTVRLWDVVTGQERLTFTGHKRPVSTVAFSADGNSLFSGDWDGTVHHYRAVHVPEAEALAIGSVEQQSAMTASDFNDLAWGMVVVPGNAVEMARAVQMAEEANRLSTNNPAHLNTLGLAYYRAGQFQKAIHALNRAGETNPRGLSAYDLFFLAMAHHQLGNVATARAFHEQAVQLMRNRNADGSSGGNTELEAFHAESARLLGLPHSASSVNHRPAPALQDAGVVRPAPMPNPDFWLSKARLALQAGRTNDALRFYTQAIDVIGTNKVGIFTNAIRQALRKRAGTFSDQARSAEAMGDVYRAFILPLGSTTAGPDAIDLSAAFNESLTGDLHGVESISLLELPWGGVELGGVRFDVRGIVHLSGRRAVAHGLRFPEQIERIPLGRKAGRLHFLHATAWDCVAGTRVAFYRVRFIDGRTEEIPLVYGKHTADWLPGQELPLTEDGPEVVWQQGSKRLYRITWTNPRPDVELANFDFVSSNTDAAPFLIAITAE